MGIESGSLPRFWSKLPANAIFSKDLGNCFPTRFVVDQVGARVFATIDRFLGQPRWHRDGQQVLWFDIKGPCFLCQIDVK